MTAQWYTIERVTRILSKSRADVLALVTVGRLRGRLIAGSPMISESSLEMYLASLPNRPAPRTFVKTSKGVVEEF
jgi:hypothetical protein